MFTISSGLSLSKIKNRKQLNFVISQCFTGFSRPWDRDRIMYTDIDAVTNILIEERVWNVVKPYIDKYNREQKTETRPSSPTTSVLRKRSKVENEMEIEIMNIL